VKSVIRGSAIEGTGGIDMRVVLVDDDQRFRGTARRALAAEGIEVVAEVADGSLAGDTVARLRPDVVLVDIRMPGVDGLEVTRLLRAVPGDPPVVILISTIDGTSGRQLAAGLASGYLPKDELSLAAIQGIIGQATQPAG
jgi:DNA-binding NarL/FixJ family response regulator